MLDFVLLAYCRGALLKQSVSSPDSDEERKEGQHLTKTVLFLLFYHLVRNAVGSGSNVSNVFPQFRSLLLFTDFIQVVLTLIYCYLPVLHERL